jgi:hypothetical protein
MQEEIHICLFHNVAYLVEIEFLQSLMLILECKNYIFSRLFSFYHFFKLLIGYLIT